MAYLTQQDFEQAEKNVREHARHAPLPEQKGPSPVFSELCHLQNNVRKIVARWDPDYPEAKLALYEGFHRLISSVGATLHPQDRRLLPAEVIMPWPKDFAEAMIGAELRLDELLPDLPVPYRKVAGHVKTIRWGLHQLACKASDGEPMRVKRENYKEVVLEFVPNPVRKRRDYVQQPKAPWVKDAVEMYKNGATLNEISAKVGCTRERIRQVLGKEGELVRGVHGSFRKLITHADEIIKSYLDGASLGEVAAKFESSPYTIKKLLVERNVPLRQKYSEEVIDTAALMYNEGKSLADIAASLHLDAMTLVKRLREAGVKIRKSNYGPPLSEEVVDQIIALRLNGMSQGEIADKLGISQPTVSSHLRKEGCTRGAGPFKAKMRSNNTSGYRGVTRHPSYPDKWHAQIGFHGELHSLGFFDDPVDAAKAYNEAAKKYHGEHAKLNDIEE